MKKSTSGFTIVELLIVIIVIAILASITVATFSGVRARALESEKATKFSQIQKSLEIFRVINGYYPHNLEIRGSSGATLIGMTLQGVVPSDASDLSIGINGQGLITSGNRYITYMATDGLNGAGYQCDSGQCTSYILSYYDRIANQAVTVVK